MRKRTVLILAAVVLLTSTAWSTDQIDRLNAGILPTVWTEPPPGVRVLYAVPSDREHSPDVSLNIARAVRHFQAWLRQELGGKTFSIRGVLPLECLMPKPHDHYATGNAWAKVESGVGHCAPIKGFWQDGNTWVVYADVEERCDEQRELGRGGDGLAILPRHDLEGVADFEDVTTLHRVCGEGPFYAHWMRWVGGLGHELSHALGLPHPPGCETRPTCEHEWSFLWKGYAVYPETYIDADSIEMLLTSPFIRRDAR